VSSATWLLVTNVDAVYRNFGEADQEAIARLTLDEARSLAASLPAGSMGSKLKAAVDFVSSCAGTAVITRPEDLHDAVEGRAGTRITLDGGRST